MHLIGFHCVTQHSIISLAYDSFPMRNCYCMPHIAFQLKHHRGFFHFEGIFLRQMFLLYQKMSFTDTGDLGKALEAYLKPKVSNEMQDPQMLSDMEIDNGEDQK